MTIGIYRDQSFGQRLDTSCPGRLLPVDDVNRFADPGKFGGGKVPEAIAATQPVLAAFRQIAGPIVFSRIVFAEDRADANIIRRKVPGFLGLNESCVDSAVVACPVPSRGELILRQTEPRCERDATGGAASRRARAPTRPTPSVRRTAGPA